MALGTGTGTDTEDNSAVRGCERERGRGIDVELEVDVDMEDAGSRHRRTESKAAPISGVTLVISSRCIRDLSESSISLLTETVFERAATAAAEKSGACVRARGRGGCWGREAEDTV